MNEERKTETPHAGPAGQRGQQPATRDVKPGEAKTAKAKDAKPGKEGRRAAAQERVEQPAASRKKKDTRQILSGITLRGPAVGKGATGRKTLGPGDEDTLEGKGLTKSRYARLVKAGAIAGEWKVIPDPEEDDEDEDTDTPSREKARGR